MALERHFEPNQLATVPAEIASISLYFSLLRGIWPENGSLRTGSSATQSGLQRNPAALSRKSQEIAAIP